MYALHIRCILLACSACHNLYLSAPIETGGVCSTDCVSQCSLCNFTFALLERHGEAIQGSFGRGEKHFVWEFGGLAGREGLPELLVGVPRIRLTPIAHRWEVLQPQAV